MMVTMQPTELAHDDPDLIWQQCLFAFDEPAVTAPTDANRTWLDDESWTLEIAKAGVRVTPGAPSTAHVQLFCKRRDLDTLIDGPSTPKLDMLRFIGSREVLDHLALLLEAGNRLLAVRVRHQAHHFLEHFKEEELA